MKILRGILCFLLVLTNVLPIVNSPSAAAVSPNGVVISHVITGESASSNSEFVALYNNSSHDIAVDGYCIKNKSVATIACIAAESNTDVVIRSHGYLTISSTVFAAAHSYVPDTSFVSSNSIQVGGDSLTLFDQLGNEIDKVTWGSSGGGIGSLTNGTLQRKSDPAQLNVLLDSDVMANDFTSVGTLIYPANTSYDVVTVVDICPNIELTQITMPAGYLSDENGNCQPDRCLNIAGLQVSVPLGYDSDESGVCSPHDECDNISGVQSAIPANMIRADGNTCSWDIPPIIITEILPNAFGDDTDNEFIEIYNPSDRTVELGLYQIKTGVNSDKTYSFPSGAVIAPGEYRAFTNNTIKFTLLNTSSRVILTAVDGTVRSDTGIYDSPKEGESWAYFTDGWRYTNTPSPGAVNTLPLVEEVNTDTTDSGLAPCVEGKYRNPLTNRCRNIVTDAAVLSSCDTDQYRNPETGRCKKIATSTLTPCKDGQYRSEETNRCRNIASATTLKPCRDNQYRSEETNRCRNVPPASVPSAAFAVQPVKDTAMAFVGWWALGGIALLAAGYAGWEWRREISVIFGRALSYFSKR